MYRRFLNNDDYLGIITPEALAQLTRGNDARFIQAEESAEMSIVEYLSENYEIEKELAKGKYIAEYDHRITYPVGVHVYFEGQIHEVIRSVSGYRKPATAIYWEECSDIHVDAGQVVNYSQFNTYYPGDKVNYITLYIKKAYFLCSTINILNEKYRFPITTNNGFVFARSFELSSNKGRMISRTPRPVSGN